MAAEEIAEFQFFVYGRELVVEANVIIAAADGAGDGFEAKVNAYQLGGDESRFVIAEIVIGAASGVRIRADVSVYEKFYVAI